MGPSRHVRRVVRRQCVHRTPVPFDIFTWLVVFLLTAALGIDGPESFSSDPSDKATRIAVPEKSKRDEARLLIREVFEAQFTAAKKDVKQRSALAAELLNLARDTDDDPATRYTALTLSLQIAITVQDSQAAFAAITEINEQFDVDRYALSIHAAKTIVDELKSIGSRAKRSKAYRRFLHDLWLIVNDAVENDQYDAAIQLGQVAITAASRSGTRGLALLVTKRCKELATLEDRYDAIHASRVKLNVEPTDASANQVLGEYFCFYKENWDKGCPLLALAEGSPYCKAARLELEGPKDADSTLAAGNAWWDAAQDAADASDADAMRRRAIHWYRRAVPKMSVSLQQRQLKKRIGSAPPRSSRDPLLEELARLVREDEQPTTPRTKNNDGDKCPRCKGQGHVDCRVRGCAKGGVKDYRTRVVGRNPISGQPVYQKYYVRVRCKVCRGKGREECPQCKGSGKKSN